MNIPIELLWFFLAMSFGLVAIGFLLRMTVPISMFLFIAGGLLFSLFVLTDNITLRSVEALNRDVSIQELYHLHNGDTDLAINSVGNTIRAIHVTSTSSLISTDFFDRLDCIQLPIKKDGNPTGNATIAVFDENQGIIIKFGTIDVSTLNTTYDWYNFCLGEAFHHFIDIDDYIGIEYTGGNSTNRILINSATNNPIDGSILISRFAGADWVDDPTSDMTAVLYNRATTQEKIYEPDNYEFTEEVKTFLVLIASVMAVTGGGIEISARRK